MPHRVQADSNYPILHGNGAILLGKRPEAGVTDPHLWELSASIANLVCGFLRFLLNQPLMGGNTDLRKSALCLPVSSLPQAEEAQMAPALEHSPCWGLSPELESKEVLFQHSPQTEP